MPDERHTPAQRCAVLCKRCYPQAYLLICIWDIATRSRHQCHEALAHVDCCLVHVCHACGSGALCSNAPHMRKNTLQVDIDLTQEGDARKVSRQQAHLTLRPDGQFQFTNIGRRTVSVNGTQIVQHRSVKLEHLSLIDLAGIHLLFMVNQLAVQRVLARSQNLVL